jgi:hypothetical protein
MKQASPAESLPQLILKKEGERRASATRTGDAVRESR